MKLMKLHRAAFSWLAALCLAGGLLAAPAVAQKTRYSSSSAEQEQLDYPLTVHVTKAWLEGAQGEVLRIEALIGGRKYELRTGATALLSPGDYRARLVANDVKKSGWFTQSYELLFNDRTHVVFTVAAVSE